ncbi:hypothetical protein FACS1894169_14350 [Bacteroidia bacterium]|nr:hypothetical protein FACS1894169_14350 [Bacteroidia bacterium]
MKTNWIKFIEKTPQKGRLFIVRMKGTEMNTDWKLRVWNLDVLERYCRNYDKATAKAEYLYID